MEKNQQAIDSLRKAIVQYWEIQDEFTEMEQDNPPFDSVINHMYKAMEALIPTAFDFVSDYIEHYTTEELIFIDEKLKGKQFDVFGYDRTTGILRLDSDQHSYTFNIKDSDIDLRSETSNNQ